MKSKKIIAVVALLLIIPLVAGCQSTKKATKTQKEATAGWKNLTFSTTSLDGKKKITTADYKSNKLTIINVWGTWCEPCVRELPELQKIADEYKSEGVKVVGVLQDGVDKAGKPDQKVIENAQKLLANAKATYEVILPDSTLNTQLISKMQYYPTTFFVDKNGKIIKTVSGSKNADEWKTVVSEVLNEATKS